MDKLTCLRCGGPMIQKVRTELQLGEYGFLTGHLGNLMSGSLPVDVWVCPTCRKLEFFLPDNPEREERKRTMVVCPVCGTEHDEMVNCPACVLAGRKPPKEKTPEETEAEKEERQKKKRRKLPWEG